MTELSNGAVSFEPAMVSELDITSAFRRCVENSTQAYSKEVGDDGLIGFQEYFLSFLGIAQRLGIDFLPITWQSVIANAHRGATAQLQERLIDTNTAYAFKKISPLHSTERSVKYFEALTTELYILGQPAVRDQPNIAHIEGVCWDIESHVSQSQSTTPNEDRMEYVTRVWPVLVFDKAIHGDLFHFIMTSETGSLAFAQRLNLCIDATRGTAYLHQNSIVHGDIKPQNILVDREGGENSALTAKIADFGHAMYFSSDEETAELVGTPFWTAPEWKRKMPFNSAAGQKMDVFSLSLVFLWTLFYRPGLETAYAVAAGSFSETSDWLLDCAKQQVEMMDHVDEISRETLLDFFEAGLQIDPAKRPSNAGKLLELLKVHRDPIITENVALSQEIASSLEQCDFQVYQSIHQLYATDYRVRAFIFNLLQSRVGAMARTHPEFLTMPSNILLQLAFCLSVGFGTPRNDRAATEIVTRQSDTFLLEYLAIKMSRTKIAARPPQYNSRTYGRILKAGHEVDMMLGDIYAAQGVLYPAVMWYIREKEDFETVFSATHPITLMLIAQISHLMRRMDQLAEAAAYRRDLTRRLTDSQGAEHPDTLMSATHMAGLYIEIGDYLNAQQILESVQKVQSKCNVAPEHPEAVEVAKCLAIVYKHMSRFGEAEALLKPAVAARKAQLGSDHSDTLQIEAALCSLYISWGRPSEARDSIIRQAEILEQRNGLEDCETLSALANLGVLRYHEEDLESAEALWVKVSTVQDKCRSRESRASSAVWQNLATLRIRLGDAEGGLEILRNLADIEAKRTGTNGSLYWDIQEKVADALAMANQLEKAEELARQVLDTKFQARGPSHRSTLRSVVSLASIYEQLGDIKREEDTLKSGLVAIHNANELETPEAKQILQRLLALVDQGATLSEARDDPVRTARD